VLSNMTADLPAGTLPTTAGYPAVDRTRGLAPAAAVYVGLKFGRREYPKPYPALARSKQTSRSCLLCDCTEPTSKRN
jgi:hypothetical protein